VGPRSSRFEMTPVCQHRPDPLPIPARMRAAVLSAATDPWLLGESRSIRAFVNLSGDVSSGVGPAFPGLVT
jgi:hypothetical protein